MNKPRWSPVQRIVLICAITIVSGSLFVTTYSLALGDPVPHRIPAAVVGSLADHPGPVKAVQNVAKDSLAFRTYASRRDALHSIAEQNVYAALDLKAARPTLYIASAAGASVARVLEKVAVADPAVHVVDVHPLAATDPNGVDIFYLMLVTTIIGFITVFQVRAQVPGLEERHHVSFVLLLALVGSLVMAAVDGPLLHRPAATFPEEWGILAVHLLAVASFASLMNVLIGRWAILPTWLFFVVLGNASSGGAVSPPLLPQPFAFLSMWLPSGSTVTALRDAIYFRDHQHLRPLAVLAAWAAGLFLTWIFVTRPRRSGPGAAVATA